MDNKEKLSLFSNEISWIKDENLREFAKEVILNADDYFFTVPASSSGKYHPTFDLGEGGLIRHTRCVAFFARTMAESLDFNDHDTDLLIIAAIAHDIKKQGDNAGHTVREHPILGGEYVEHLAKAKGLISEDDAKKIENAIKSHMGRWEHRAPWAKGEPYPMPETDFEKALQAADYVASRKEILSFNFGDNCIINENITFNGAIDTQSSMIEPKDYIISFGKHRGKKLEEIKNTGYLEWMIGQNDFFHSEAQDMARKYLSSLNEKAEEPKNSVPKNAYIVDDLPF